MTKHIHSYIHTYTQITVSHLPLGFKCVQGIALSCLFTAIFSASDTQQAVPNICWINEWMNEYLETSRCSIGVSWINSQQLAHIYSSNCEFQYILKCFISAYFNFQCSFSSFMSALATFKILIRGSFTHSFIGEGGSLNINSYACMYLNYIISFKILCYFVYILQ